MNTFVGYYVDYFMLLPQTIAKRGKYPLLRVFGVLLIIPYLPVTAVAFLGLLLIGVFDVLQSAWRGELGK